MTNRGPRPASFWAERRTPIGPCIVAEDECAPLQPARMPDMTVRAAAASAMLFDMLLRGMLPPPPVA